MARAAAKALKPVDHAKPPYLHHWGDYAGFHGWIVNGDAVRRRHPDFTNVEQGYREPWIPKDEIWIDNGLDAAEVPIVFRHGVRAAQMMRRGVPYGKAETAAAGQEKIERRGIEPRVLRLRVMHLGGNGQVNGYLVNGRGVRDEFDDEYTLGGHSRKYKWIPKGEIWLDDDAAPNDRPFNFLHELFEYNEMGKGRSYDVAHAGALRAELAARRHPERFLGLLRTEERRAGGPMGLERVPEFRQLMLLGRP